jgi:hypothetical protein
MGFEINGPSGTFQVLLASILGLGAIGPTLNAPSVDGIDGGFQ